MLKSKFFKRSFLLFCLLAFCTIGRAAAQQYGVVEEHKNPLIERLQKERMLISKSGALDGGITTERKEGVPLKTGKKVTARGYRVQIYSGSDRSSAYEAQAKFKEIYKDLNTYVSYEQPNYRVKVGDFTNRNHALALMNQLKQQFTSVFIFTETVNLEI